MDKQDDRPIPARRPVAPPRKSTAIATPIVSDTTETSLKSNVNKPKIAMKPKPPIAVKPKGVSLRHSPSDENKAEVKVQSSRPKSIKVTDDGVHGKVANELASILGRPRSSSKGLLSPTSYSNPAESLHVTTDFGNEGVKPTASEGTDEFQQQQFPPKLHSPPKPIPRSRPAKPHADPAISPQSGSDAATIPHMKQPSPNPTEEKETLPAPVKSKPARPPGRPPPPSIKRPPPPSVSKQSTAQQASAESTTVSSVPESKVKLTPTPAVKPHSPSVDTTSSQQPPGRRKLEITVLGARPMSEVGFRDLKIPTAPTTTPSTAGNSQAKTVTSTEYSQTSLNKPPPVSQASTKQASRLGESTDSNGITEHKKDSPISPPQSASSGNTSVSTSPQDGADTTHSTATAKPHRKPTIIRPGRPTRPSAPPTSESDSLVSKPSPCTPPSLPKPAQKPAISTHRPQSNSLPSMPPAPVSPQKRAPPQSLSIKKDPWNQIVKGPGPIDNLAFSTGDTPPPKPQGLPPLPVITKMEELKPVTEDSHDALLNVNTGTATTNGAHPVQTSDSNKRSVTDDSKPASNNIMDQSLELKYPVDLKPTPAASTDMSDEPANMFYQTSSQSQAPATGKPSALQRIYGYKKAREEKQPEKYKHRPDCYVDKPNNDSSFWRPSAEGTTKHGGGKLGSNSVHMRNSPSTNNKRTGKCVAKYDFPGETKTDLPFKEGDKIVLLEKVDMDWYKGSIGSKQGLFPAAYVEVIEDISMEETTSNKTKRQSIVTAFAAFDFVGTESTDLSLKGGQEVTILAKVDSEWLYGEVGGKKGVFPALYVSVCDEDVEDLPVHKLAAVPTQKHLSNVESVWATALFDFIAEHESELTLKAGDRVKVISGTNDEWSTGEKDGKTGLFPTSFVALETTPST